MSIKKIYENKNAKSNYRYQNFIYYTKLFEPFLIQLKM